MILIDIMYIAKALSMHRKAIWRFSSAVLGWNSHLRQHPNNLKYISTFMLFGTDYRQGRWVSLRPSSQS